MGECALRSHPSGKRHISLMKSSFINLMLFSKAALNASGNSSNTLPENLAETGCTTTEANVILDVNSVT